MQRDIYLPYDAKIIERKQELKDVFTLTLEFTDPKVQETYSFQPGQFNMLYLYGVGEVAISIVASQQDINKHLHTIRRVGRVTHGLSELKVGDHIGVRGAYGRGWPLEPAKGKDVLVITGGLGCAPSVSIINYILHNRDEFGKLTILQGVKHSQDFIYREQYKLWAACPNTEVLLAADVSAGNWPWFTGLITELLDHVTLEVNNTICMMCGPEAMLNAAVKKLQTMQFKEDDIYLNLERNMECAVGHCGHCQFGGYFICKDGPVFSYPEVSHLLGRRGF